MQDGHQRWKCRDCGKKFQANKTTLPSKEALFCLYVFGKQTFAELSERFHKKRAFFQALFDTVVFKEKAHDPRPIALCVDATFFGHFGVVVFRDEKRQENLWWRFVDEERLTYYEEGKRFLEEKGYVIVSVTGDGLTGLPALFQDIPFQYCHFHARKTVRTYLTKFPKTDAGIALSVIMKSIKNYNQESFVVAITDWHVRYANYLQQKTFSIDGSWEYTHRKLRGALRSIVHMSPFLYTYQTRADIYIPPTTNTLEGHFSHIKVRCGVHRSIGDVRLKKLLHALLLASSVSYHEDLPEKLF